MNHGVTEDTEQKGESSPCLRFRRVRSRLVWRLAATLLLTTLTIVLILGATVYLLTRYYVLVCLDYATRKVEIAGICRQPNGQWMKQVARNLTDPFSGFLRGKKYLIHDRDPCFQPFDEVLPESLEVVRLPRRSPNLNAYAERFVRSIKDECLSRMVLFGERSLRKATREYAAH